VVIDSGIPRGLLGVADPREGIDSQPRKDHVVMDVLVGLEVIAGGMSADVTSGEFIDVRTPTREQKQLVGLDGVVLPSVYSLTPPSTVGSRRCS